MHCPSGSKLCPLRMNVVHAKECLLGWLSSCTSVFCWQKVLRAKRGGSCRRKTGSLVTDNLDSIGKAQINIVASNDSTLAYLSGRIDIDSSPAVRDRLLGMLQPPSAKIVSVDLSGVTHIDSSGVATLIEALKIARGNKTELRLQGLDEGLYRLFESTRILSLFDGGLPRANRSEREAG
jgi:anti-sigma B factor antagonist